MMRLTIPFVLAAPLATAVQTQDSWKFVFDFVEELRAECTTIYNAASENWAKQSTQCAMDKARYESDIERAEDEWQQQRHQQERQESKANQHANTVAALAGDIARTETEKTALLQAITTASNDFTTMAAEYADNIAVLEKAIAFNMQRMDAASCIPKKTTVATTHGCDAHTTTEACSGNSSCRWERPSALTKIQKMLNTLQDKFRTERMQAHDDYLKLKHNQELAKLSMSQIIVSLNAQMNDAKDLENKANVAATDAKNAARDQKVLKDDYQEALVTLEAACKGHEANHDQAVAVHTKCAADVNDLNQLIQSSVQQAIPNFVQLSTVNDRVKAMDIVRRAADHFGDNTLLSLLQVEETATAPDRTATEPALGAQDGPADMNAPNPATVVTPNNPTAAYNTWMSTQICPAITQLMEARVGCDISDAGCEIEAQAKWFCRSLKCISENESEECAAFTTTSTCDGADVAYQCKVDDPQTCEADLINLVNERTILGQTIADLEDQLAETLNSIATKEASVDDKRDAIKQANAALRTCQETLDAARATYEDERSRTKAQIESAEVIVNLINANFGSTLNNPDSIASKLMKKLNALLTTLNFQYAAQETTMDAAVTTHSDCSRVQTTLRQVARTEQENLQGEISQLEMDKVSISKTLGNTRKVHSKTDKVENEMQTACVGTGGKIDRCSDKFVHTVEDLQNAENILCHGV